MFGCVHSSEGNVNGEAGQAQTEELVGDGQRPRLPCVYHSMMLLGLKDY